ncbi:hypothetical protein [Streptomyces sp. NBC_01304]|nr:hypothetical protein OG430_42315 [Streptomyces sp. NBC_01304]
MRETAVPEGYVLPRGAAAIHGPRTVSERTGELDITLTNRPGGGKKK